MLPREDSPQASHLRERFRKVSRSAAIAVIGLGGVVLLGWVAGVQRLVQLLPSFPSMKANTAVCFVLLGSSLVLAQQERHESLRRALALVVVSIAAATGLEDIFGIDLRIDELLLQDTYSKLAPGRMAPESFVNFTLLGLALFSSRRSTWSSRLAYAAVVAATLVSFTTLTGYAFGAISLYEVEPFTSIAPHTALGFLAASIAFLTGDPDRGLASIATTKSSAGILVRRLLPAVVVGPVLLGWLRLLGEQHGLHDDKLGMAIVTVGDVLLLSTVLFLVAARLHRADQALRSNEERFRLAIEASPTGMLIVDPAGNIVLVNAQVERLFGYTRGELVGSSLELLVPPAQRDAHVAHRKGYLLAPQARRMGLARELRGVRKDGSEFPVEIGLSPLQEGADLVLSVIIDMTERRRAEAEHVELVEQRKTTELLRERGRFFELSIDMVCIASSDGRFQQLNPAFSRTLGYSLPELEHESVFDFVHPDDRDATTHELENLRSGQRVIGFSNRYRCKDGRYRWLQWQAAPEVDGTIYAVARDVTQDRELIEELRGQQASLSASLEEREVLLQEVHHRVKNNLQVVSSLINMQKRQLRDEAARQALVDCKARVETIGLIHEELHQTRDFAHVHLGQYVKRLAHGLFQAVGPSSSGISLEIDVDDVALPVGRVIPCGLILNELITNALKHAFPGRDRGVVSIEVRETDDRVVVSVTDDGVGMPQAFDPGTSSSLGMQLVEMLSRQLDGRVEIARGNGTSIRLTFPAKG
jgi:PAS domain S-box-containing protein